MLLSLTETHQHEQHHGHLQHFVAYSVQQTHTFVVFDEVTAHAQIMADLLG